MAYCKIKKDGTPAKKCGRKPIFRPAKPEFDRHAPRPQVWKTGPDEELHQMYMPWLKAKAQANYREEGWNLSFEEFAELWNDHWDQRGRSSNSMCMTRIDPEKPWTRDNTEVIQRYAHIVKQGKERRKYKEAYYELHGGKK